MNKNYKNIAKIKAIDKKNEQRLLAVNPNLDNKSGIYFLTRKDSETGIRFSYVGQALHIKDRLLQHLRNYQRIDISIKAHGLISKDNPDGWDINFLHFPPEQLNEKERYFITLYAKKGYQSRNIDTGGGSGKRELGERKASKGYRDGLNRGYKNASRDIAHLFEKHLDYKPKNYPPNRYQKQAMEKFEEFLNVYKEEHSELPKDNGAINTVEEEVKKYGRTVMPGNS